MAVTLRYENGSAAVYASLDEALEQASHDWVQPGHLNPAQVLEGDLSEEIGGWREAEQARRQERYSQALRAAHAAVEERFPDPEDERRGGAFQKATEGVAVPVPVPLLVDVPDGVRVVRSPGQLARLVCRCKLCEWHRLPHEERLKDAELGDERRHPAR